MELRPNDLGLLITLAMAALSVRLIRVAWRMRSLPELLVGLHFLCAPIGISLSIRVDRFDPQHAEAVRAAVGALFASGTASLLLFGWRVFHPASLWAKACACFGVALLATIWGAELASGAFARSEVSGVRTLLFTPYLWVFVESLRYHGLMRKRMRLGLADPVTTNRFLLFAIWTGGVVAITVLGLVGGLLAGRGTESGELFTDATILALTRIVAVPIAVSIWLTFSAPARYRRWLERGTAVPAGI
jgi:hypothetical protein